MLKINFNGVFYATNIYRFDFGTVYNHFGMVKIVFRDVGYKSWSPGLSSSYIGAC